MSENAHDVPVGQELTHDQHIQLLREENASLRGQVSDTDAQVKKAVAEALAEANAPQEYDVTAMSTAEYIENRDAVRKQLGLDRSKRLAR
ncbi:hypothetical protein [Planctomycetes bacterium TBK1r]|uniref:Uncharacterized protein n=1 Tax=Stieleria magnilauensis TaxID=2527963 RepID=A0ABX5XJY1_9BACT|nr:hypothetical protein TBK1r_05840 [Planctomycetes bacterium TBK1r]